jgi:hypothetical protein
MQTARIDPAILDGYRLANICDAMSLVADGVVEVSIHGEIAVTQECGTPPVHHRQLLQILLGVVRLDCVPDDVLTPLIALDTHVVSGMVSE